MDDRQLRRKSAISYEVSSDSDSQPSTSNDSPFGSPAKPVRRQRRSAVEREEETDTEAEEAPIKTPPPRLSTAGHSLRQHKDLHLSLRALENGDKRAPKTRKHLSTRKRLNATSSGGPKPVPVKTERNLIRDAIVTGTAVKRNNFFLCQKHLFLPLLPEKNHITKLAEKSALDGQEEDILAISEATDSLDGAGYRKDNSVPYEELTQQPRGIKAVMKPYQLSGLSFLVYLHRNGLSGILGDEMGLGKTLQTLALIQYLKERGSLGTGTENRPSIVVCPLSVLSSWMNEARKWAPGLKVLRFHGPVHERDRLKRIAIGEIDTYGYETKRHKIKKQVRKTKAGSTFIDLGSASETENEIGVDLIVTTYECFQAEQSWFKRAFVWNYIVLDEGHKIKNETSQIAKSLQALSAEFRLILTGTPLHNNMQELWALLHWLYPEVFTEDTSVIFKEAFNLTKGQVSTTFMDDARRLLERIMLRRMKNSEGVDLNLPPKTEVFLYTPLSPMQRFWYQRLMTRCDQGLLDDLFQNAKQKEAAAINQDAQEQRSHLDTDLGQLASLDQTDDSMAWQESKEIVKQTLDAEQQGSNKSGSWQKLRNLLMQLRMCCNHPYLLPHAEPSPYYVGEHIVTASGKFILLDKILKELVIKQKKKILIFSFFTRMLDCCEDLLNLRGGGGEHFRYLRLEGSTSRARRNLNIRMFNQMNSEERVMLISTRAGGLGINLTGAADVVMMDQDWNPQVTLQAEARAHRIGQDKPVTIYKLCTQGTVEEQMLGRIQKKLYLSTKVTESMQNVHAPKQAKKGLRGRSSAADEDMPQLNTGELMSLVRRGARALAHPELDVNQMLQWDWAAMLENCKDKPADAIVAKDTGAASEVKEEDERKWLEQVEQVQSRVFEGKKYLKQKDDYSSIAQEWSRADRRVGKETTVMVDGFAISKQSMSCGDWEAVPTMAGKDPRLAEPKRAKKAAIINQEQCQVCWDGGDLTLCSHCPRSYHYDCLDPNAKVRSRMKMGFSCSQHQCWDCEQKTQDVGGMIFRCRWCERGFCEDCLDWDKTELIGDNLKEYELLEFPSGDQAFYICCPLCKDHHESEPSTRLFCENQAQEIDRQYEIMLREQNAKLATEVTELKSQSSTPETQSLTEGSTIDSSAVATPYCIMDDGDASSKKKRKAAPTAFKMEVLSLDDPALATGALYQDDSDSYASSTKKRKIVSGRDKSKATRRSGLLSSPLAAREYGSNYRLQRICTTSQGYLFL
ncbi:MAG: hypothetical protein Q9221_005041 [Calogaya cf. arnoldii]